MLEFAADVTFWTGFLALATLLGAVALIAGFWAGYRQLKAAKTAAQQQTVAGQEEMLLRFSAVYHDMMPPKRRITASVLSALRTNAIQPGDAQEDDLNAFADVVRFFESVRFAIETAQNRDRSSPNLSDPLAMEFGRYATGYYSTLKALPEPTRWDLIRKALPRHEPVPTVGEGLVMGTLLEISRRATDAQKLVIGSPPETHGWLWRLFHGFPDTTVEQDGSPNWGAEDVEDFLRREMQAKRARELSRVSTPLVTGTSTVSQVHSRWWL